MLLEWQNLPQIPLFSSIHGGFAGYQHWF